MPDRSTWTRAVVLVGATRIAFLVVASVAAAVEGRPGGGDLWRRWDANLYLEIAEHGYHGEPTDPWAEAFLPLYPLAVRLLLWLGIPPVAAGLLVSAVASVVAIAYLIRLVEERHEAPGRRAALLLLVFPTAVFLVAPYTEALFLAGAIPAFHHARRGEWGAAALPAAVAAGTRVVGVFVLLGLAVLLVHQVRRAPERPRLVRRGLTSLAAALLPFVAYLAWLAAVRGDPLYLLTAQRAGWARTLTPPWEAWRTTVGAAGTAEGWLAVTWRLEIVGLVLGLLVLAVTVARRDWDYAAFVGPTVAVLAVSSWFYSTPRILLTLFPAVVYLAAWTAAGGRWRHPALLTVFAPMAAAGTVAFTRGMWFF